MFGFGWRQAPSVRDLVGVTASAEWLEGTPEERGGVAGLIRIYDSNPNSAGALVGALVDQILMDREAGNPVPSLGLSAVFFHCARLDEDTGLTVTSEIAHVESVDWVYSPGAGGYVRAALARLPAFRQVWGIGAEGARTAPLQQEAQVSEETMVVEAAGAMTAPQAPTQDPAVNEMLTALEARLAALEGQGSQQDAGGPRGRQDAGGPSGPSVSRETGGSQQDAGGPGGQGQQDAGGPEPAFDLAALDAQLGQVRGNLDRLLALMAGREEGETVQGHGEAPRTRVRVGPGSLEQVQLAVEGLIAGTNPAQGVQPLTGIRELYMLLSGDYEMTGMYQGDRVYLANVTASTMAGLVANALNKVVINEFMAYPQWWAPAVTVMDFPTLQDVRWITLGGVGELPTVSEGAAYAEMTWDDQTETDAFVKKGGYLGITLEAIDKDDTARVRTAPRALAQAAWLTLGNSISDIFTSNSGAGPTMADTGALFNATAVSTTGGHANLLTTALSISQWRVVKIAMMKQAEVNSSTRLGALTRPRLLWVPVDLEDTAVQILATEHDPGSANYNANVDATGNTREARLANARSRVIVCPLWTDTNNWAAQADPLLYPSIGLGFRYGRTPEIFSVASPTAGLMFTNDTMPVKVRFFYAVGPTDWRGLHKSNV